MPHAGLIPSNISPEEELLHRAKLHVRGGRIRLENGETADAIAAFYDAMISAMQRYFISEGLRRDHKLPTPNDISDEEEHLKILLENDVVNADFGIEELEQFSSLLEKAFSGDVDESIDSNLMRKYESLMTELGVLPIEDDELPDEVSVTT